MDPRVQILRRKNRRPDEIQATDLEAIRARAFAFLDAGHAERARDLFDLIVVFEGEDPATDLALACCYQGMGEITVAREHLARALDEKSGASPELRMAAAEWGRTLVDRDRSTT